ncbi:MAG TPA: hypothetical protein VEA92_01845 [Candidatus Paceibacterota bacterium]|nr:hypothetical protein [Candidatus Paceibacterota bacterium]
MRRALLAVAVVLVSILLIVGAVDKVIPGPFIVVGLMLAFVGAVLATSAIPKPK